MTEDSNTDIYSREPIAIRVVYVTPSESWRVVPIVYEDE